ncbi:MAG: GNAT family N-acetyltransferase [Pseudomonadota bacterium]
MIEPLHPDRLILKTKRLTIAPLRMSDLDLVQRLLCDADVMHYVTGEAETPEAVKRNLPNAVRRGAGGRIGFWSISDNATGSKIGDVILMPVPIDQDDYDFELLVPDAYPDAKIEVGYLLVPQAWGRGIATEACARLLRFAFEETPLTEIFATTDPDNKKSQNVLRKCGLRAIGKRRAYAWDDVDWFQVTRTEWHVKGTRS